MSRGTTWLMATITKNDIDRFENIDIKKRDDRASLETDRRNTISNDCKNQTLEKQIGSKELKPTEDSS